jgi:hypothetical protein
MFAIDTHVHLLVGKAAPPLWDEIAFATTVASADGLAVLCVTEHLDANHYPALVRGLFGTLRLGGRLLSPGSLLLDHGLLLSCGAEVALEGGGDIGVHAAPQVLLELDRRKGAYSLAALLAALRAQPAPFALVAHHVLWPRKAIDGLARHAGALDALELPGKDAARAEAYRSRAAELDLPMVGGSDAHTWVQIGSARSVVAAAGIGIEAFSPSLLRSLLRDNAIEAQVLDAAPERVRISSLLRGRIEAALPTPRD